MRRKGVELEYSVSCSTQFSIHYRPQTKFPKVMFLHVSVCPLQGGVSGQIPPRKVHPPGRYPPGQVHPPPGRYTLPRAVHVGRYRQQAGGMHPIGMHSCFLHPVFCPFFLFNIQEQESIPVGCVPPASVATTRCQYQWGTGIK